jgi:hypothetical protein
MIGMTPAAARGSIVRQAWVDEDLTIDNLQFPSGSPAGAGVAKGPLSAIAENAHEMHDNGYSKLKGSPIQAPPLERNFSVTHC